MSAAEPLNADCLIALGHALIRVHGDDRIPALAEAFAVADFNPLYAGEAAT